MSCYSPDMYQLSTWPSFRVAVTNWHQHLAGPLHYWHLYFNILLLFTFKGPNPRRLLLHLDKVDR
jgi:hypothetical protein